MPLAADPHTAGLPGSAPDDSALVGGITNHLEFARRVATVLLAYDSGTDFTARNADLLRASSPTPYGDAAGLADDLEKFTPTDQAIASLRSTDTHVSVTLSEVAVSDWAARTLAARGASSGVYGIDITGSQQISAAGATPIVVPVEVGVAVACPPAVAFCTLAGVVPQHLEDALASR